MGKCFAYVSSQIDIAWQLKPDTRFVDTMQFLQSNGYDFKKSPFGQIITHECKTWQFLAVKKFLFLGFNMLL